MRRPDLPPLGIPLLAALLLHGLWLSLGHLQSRRQPQPMKLSARDDTAELLLLSKSMPDQHEMGIVPLPPQLNLPPPPPALLSALPPPPDARGPRPPGTKTAGPAKTSAPRKGALRVAPPPRRPGVSKAVSSRTTSPHGTTSARPPKTAASAPLATLLSLKQKAAFSSPTEQGDLAATAGETPLLRPQGEAADSWRKLWESARSASADGKDFGDLPESVELRALPLAQARGAGVNPTHGQAVVLADHLILLWVENGTLWMLRSPTTPG